MKSNDRYVVVELDVVLDPDETLESMVNGFADGHDVTVQLLKAVGPAGGHPLVMVVGPRAEVIKVMEHGAYPLDDYGLAPETATV